MRGLRRLARKSDTSSGRPLGYMAYARMLFIMGRRLRRLVWLALATSSAGKRARACGAGRGLAFSLTATAQTRTRETAEASNEIIPRGGVSARVFEAKPSPFLIFLRWFGEKIGGRGGLLGRLLLENGLRFASRKPAKNGLEIWLRKEYFSILLFKECLK